VRAKRTTTCCSAVVLIVLSVSIAVRAQPQADAPLSLFPVRGLWTLALNNALAAPPGFFGARGYFPLHGGRLAAYDLVAGTLLWIVETATTLPPAAGDGLVFLVEPDAIVARHDRDGAVSWRTPLPEPLATPLAWMSGWVVATEASGSTVALRAVDGKVLWRRDLGSTAQARPTITDERVHVSLEDARVVALELATGVTVWERRLGGPPSDILVAGDRLYVGSRDNYLYNLRAVDGRVDWRWQTGADVVGLPVADDRRVYFVSLDNVLRALDRRSGSQQWKRTLPIRPRGGPLAVGDALLVAGLAPGVRAFRTANGTPAGDIPTTADLAAPPHVVPGPAGPIAIVLTRDLISGVTVHAFIRQIEPAMTPVAALPNPIPVAPVVPAAPVAPPAPLPRP
jgi:hypothetical protein